MRSDFSSWRQSNLFVRVLFLNTDYSNFLVSLYRARPSLPLRDYDAQMAVRNASFFGTANFMSRRFEMQGHAAIDVHANNWPLQAAWAPHWSNYVSRAVVAACRFAPQRFLPRMVGLPVGSPHFDEILAAQIAVFKPTILYNHDPSTISADWLKAHIPASCALVGQIASPRNPTTNWKAYDLMISSLPNFVATFRHEGIAAEYVPLCFEPTLLDGLPKVRRDIPLSFVGSLSPAHTERLALVEAVARSEDLEVWGEGVDALTAESPITPVHHGQAWGPDMFTVLRRSQMTLNKHIDVAENYANNMRLFEATGTGACLVTDAKDNLEELFLPGKEVLAYRDVEECVDLIRYYCAHETERDRIAEAGQHRCLRDHTYERRMVQLSNLLSHYFH